MNITPVVLTFNEDRNIENTLSSLRWASRIVVVDSGSTDNTAKLAHSFSNVDWFVRNFDTHKAQWTYAIHQTSIETDYVLALDADMRATVEFQREMEAFLKNAKFDGASIAFEYRVLGRPLIGSIYPAQTRLFRKNKVQIAQPGHSQEFVVAGNVYRFRSRLIHEDLKPFSRWLKNQISYAALEASRIRSHPRTGVKDWLRSVGLAPPIVGAVSYIRAGGPLRPAAAKAYACERLIFEAILARMLAERAQEAVPQRVEPDGSVLEEVCNSRR
jgi:glycosyltransferase involved in cell wall biosynthesis